MDVPLALNDIGIRYGSKGYKRKSSTFSHKAVVDGLSALEFSMTIGLRTTSVKQNLFWLELIEREDLSIH